MLFTKIIISIALASIPAAVAAPFRQNPNSVRGKWVDKNMYDENGERVGSVSVRAGHTGYIDTSDGYGQPNFVKVSADKSGNIIGGPQGYTYTDEAQSPRHDSGCTIS